MCIKKITILLIFSLILFMSSAQAEQVKLNGTQYYERLDGSMTETPSIITDTPQGKRIDWRGMYYFTVWDGINAYDTFNYPNGTFVSPWVFPRIEYWRTTGSKRWVEVIPLNNTFEQRGNQIIRRMKMGDGSLFNITYTATDKIKYTWVFTAGQNQNYSIVLRMDSAASEDINLASKRYTPGWFSNRTFYSYGDVQEPYARNISSWYSSGDRKFFQRIILGQQGIGNRTEIDPSVQFNGSTSPAWQNTSFDNETSDPINIVLGISADKVRRVNNTDMNANTGKNKWYEDVGSAGFNITNNAAYPQFAWGDVSDTDIPVTANNYTVSFTLVGVNDDDTNWFGLAFYQRNLSQDTTGVSNPDQYILLFFPYYNYIYYRKYVGGSIITIEDWTGATVNVNDNWLVDTSTVSSGLKIYRNGILHHTFPADSAYTNGSLGFGGGGTMYGFKNYAVRQSTSGNSTHNYSFQSGRQASQFMVNFTNASGIYVDAYTSADNVTYNLAMSNVTNATLLDFPVGDKAQNSFVRFNCKGNATETCEIMEVTITDEAVGGGGAPDGAIPPNPTNLAQTNSSIGFWINYTWQNGSGNITNSYNVSVNGTWTNGSANNFSNSTVSPHGWRNITAWAFNSSGNGNLSTGSVTLNTQIPNNVPVQQSIGDKSVTENSWLNFSVSSTDADGDALTYATNATKGNLNGYNFSWKPDLVDAGTYYWTFNTTDNYSAVATETITITVNNIDFIPPVPTIGTVTTGNFYVNTTWNAGAGNVTDGYNTTNGTIWINGTNPYRNTTLSAHAWQNLTIYAWNSSYGNLSATALTNNTQIPNNVPILDAIGNKNTDEGTWLNFTVTGTDLDSDSLTCATNATKGTLSNCNFNWSISYSDADTYYWNFNISDGYGGLDDETITVTINEMNFTSIWNTSKTSAGSSNATSITLPLELAGTYNFTVRWGDGSSDNITTYNQANVTHTYASEGVYNLVIDGTLIGFRFNNGGDKLKLLDITRWSNMRVGNSNEYFYGASNFNSTAPDQLDLTGTTTMVYMFSDATNFNQNIGSWNVSQVTNMIGMFDDATNFNQSIINWDVSQVTTMGSMFQSATNFNQNISNWNTSKVTNMNSMFYGATNFNQNIGSWDVSKVTNMNYMFYSATNFNQSIINWDVSQVTTMGSMFRSAPNFNQNIGNWNVSQVTSMANMFLDTTLGTCTYSDILIGWASLPSLSSSVPLHGGSSQYASNAGSARNDTLIGTYLWSITDGGYNATAVCIAAAETPAEADQSQSWWIS